MAYYDILFKFKGKDTSALLERLSDNINGIVVPFSFKKIIPIPTNDISDIVDNWGCSSDCYNTCITSNNDIITVSFVTENGFPKPIILKLTEIIANQGLDVSFIVKYCAGINVSGSYWYEPVVSGGNGELQFKIDTTLSDRIKRNIEINGNSLCFYQDCDGNYHNYTCDDCPNYQNCC